MDRAKLMQVLEEAEKSRRNNKNLELELKQLREENKKLKEKIRQQSLDEEGQPLNTRNAKVPVSRKFNQHSIV